jgi:Phosphotransferase enzyme family
MADLFVELTSQAACELLRGVGVTCLPGEVEVVARDERYAVLLPTERIAWFPASESGSKRLEVERRVLSLLAKRCSFRVPRVLATSARGFDVRQMVPGQCDPWDLYRRCQADPRLARKIGREIGVLLAEQHAKVIAADVAGWLSEQITWPESGSWIRERLPRVVTDDGLIKAMVAVIKRYEAVPVGVNDRVLVHGDVGLHNLALDPGSDTINGIFDYDSAAWADRHHDFRYLLFDVEREDMLDAALEVYEPMTRQRIDRERVRLYNAACAISFLALRVTVPADQKSCGRTLTEDIRWVRVALSKVTSG